MALRDVLTVMVVDDMSTSRSLIIMALEEMGIKKVDFSNDGASALQALAQRPAHLVISDYNMPNMDGLHLLQALRNAPATKGIGFILVSGKVDQNIINVGRQLGMNNFIKKPFTTVQMRDCIQAVVGQL
ncbi:response regulator [Seohaeicola nanhaiensis]|uniref:Response regulator n=1 Tax=Seohaeicola nanhaiensis TaxID=1387282 RepID=A0ABV9KBN8_9RHOB